MTTRPACASRSPARPRSWSASATYRAAIYAVYGRTSVGRIATHWLPGYLDVFGLGIALAAVSAYVAIHGTTPLVDAIGRLSWLWWTLAVVCFWLVVKHLGLPRSPQPQNTPIGWQADEQQILQALFAGFACLPAIFGPQDRGLIRRFLQWRPVAYAGLVSYGVYLWHEGWLDKWLVWTGRPDRVAAQLDRATSPWTFPLILGLTVLSSLVGRDAELLPRRPPGAEVEEPRAACSAERTPHRSADARPAAERSAEPPVAPATHPFDFPCFDGLRAIAVMSAILEHVGFVSGAEFGKRGSGTRRSSPGSRSGPRSSS